MDLSECLLMDSTFLGVLAGFGLQMRICRERRATDGKSNFTAQRPADRADREPGHPAPVPRDPGAPGPCRRAARCRRLTRLRQQRGPHPRESGGASHVDGNQPRKTWHVSRRSRGFWPRTSSGSVGELRRLKKKNERGEGPTFPRGPAESRPGSGRGAGLKRRRRPRFRGTAGNSGRARFGRE
jgi:hypothetical protein